MKINGKERLASVLNLIAQLFFAMAGMSFFFGGGLIHAISQSDRIFAEVEGVGLTVLSGGIGAAFMVIANRLEGNDRPVSLFDSVRK